MGLLPRASISAAALTTASILSFPRFIGFSLIPVSAPVHLPKGFKNSVRQRETDAALIGAGFVKVRAGNGLDDGADGKGCVAAGIGQFLALDPQMETAIRHA